MTSQEKSHLLINSHQLHPVEPSSSTKDYSKLPTREREREKGPGTGSHVIEESLDQREDLQLAFSTAAPIAHTCSSWIIPPGQAISGGSWIKSYKILNHIPRPIALKWWWICELSDMFLSKHHLLKSQAPLHISQSSHTHCIFLEIQISKATINLFQPNHTSVGCDHIIKDCLVNFPLWVKFQFKHISSPIPTIYPLRRIDS